MILKADEIDFDQNTGDAQARGNVRFENFLRGEKLQCEKAEYNVDEKTGKFYNVSGSAPAKVQTRPGLLTTSNPFYFEGDWAERLKDKYILHDGLITDCLIPKPWWILRGPKFDVIPGQRALGYRSVFALRHIPMLYAPVIYKSLEKQPRHSGFLTPNIGNSSSRGFMLGMGYYWAINRSYDLLYRPQYFSARGLAHHVDFRGKVNDKTDFDFILYGVNDRGVRVGDTIQKQGGYLFSITAKSDLGHGFEAKADINYLSSFLFRQSFTESFREAIFSESHSVAYITKHWSSYAFNFVFQRTENFQSVAPDDKIIIRKLPQGEFIVRERVLNDRVLPIWFSLDSSGGLLFRTQPLFQTRQFVGRFDVAPRLSTALQFWGFSLSPSVAIRETGYDSSVRNGKITDQNILRSSREVSVELVTPSLERVYKAPKWLGDKMKHVIEARGNFDYVSGIGTDFNKLIRFDTTELLTNTTEASFTIINRLYVKQSDGQVKEVVTWEVGQKRYFDPTFGGVLIPGQRNVIFTGIDETGYAFLDRPRNYSPVTSEFRVNGRIGLSWRTDYDPLRGQIVNSGFSADYRFSDYFISAGHNQVHSVDIAPVGNGTYTGLSPQSNQLRGSFGIGRDNRKGWNAGTNLYYDYRKQVLQYLAGQVTYNTDCCGFSVQYRRFAFGTRNENQFRLSFSISNVGSFGTLRRQEKIF